MAKKTTKKNVKKTKKDSIKDKSSEDKVEEISAQEREQNKTAMWFFVIILLTLGGSIIGYLYVKDSNEFSYGGVNFTRVKDGIEYYHGKTPIMYNGKVSTFFNLYFRHNPKQNKIPINTEEFALSREVVISFDPQGQEEQKCRAELAVGHANLKQFMEVFPWVDFVSGAVIDEDYANEKGLNFANCESSHENKTVIRLVNSGKFSIEKEENCYIVNVKDCGYNKGTERLMMGFVAKINNATL